MVVVQIPTLPEYAGHVPRSLRVSLTPEQAIKLCQIRCCGLVAEGAALSTGEAYSSPSHRTARLCKSARNLEAWWIRHESRITRHALIADDAPRFA